MAELLPPNTTPLERHVSAVTAELGALRVPLRALMNPDTCPASLLPWLAWHLGIDAWKDYWPEQVKRARVRAAIPVARRKGTAAAVRDAVAAFGANIVVREWWQCDPPGPPHTFELVMTISSRDGERATAALVADVIDEVQRTKPVRAHFTFTQGFEQLGALAVAAAIRPALYCRLSLSDA
ncbi:phage tail protein I [Pandoraea sp.]|uniref:phage tail protein I n=1 Tax=Pandoraea sp. TaxID=1883445 RepID=UPI0011FCA1C6|nr:phage tail protein I [Pandoraea sp.]TAL53816.1 MAG: phage tail protein I [Pandoraea sp.]TAM17069.1 MAG: phage tail protein I [Pandoraea sp.]